MALDLDREKSVKLARRPRVLNAVRGLGKYRPIERILARAARGKEVRSLTIMRLLRACPLEPLRVPAIGSNSPKKPHPEIGIDAHDQVDP